MNSNVFKSLVVRFADGRKVCNCGEAYYSNTGRASTLRNGVWLERSDAPTCESGCSTNQIRAKYEIAERMDELLGEGARE